MNNKIRLISNSANQTASLPASPINFKSKSLSLKTNFVPEERYKIFTNNNNNNSNNSNASKSTTISIASDSYPNSMISSPTTPTSSFSSYCLSSSNSTTVPPRHHQPVTSSQRTSQRSQASTIKSSHSSSPMRTPTLDFHKCDYSNCAIHKHDNTSGDFNSDETTGTVKNISKRFANDDNGNETRSVSSSSSLRHRMRINTNKAMIGQSRLNMILPPDEPVLLETRRTNSPFTSIETISVLKKSRSIDDKSIRSARSTPSRSVSFKLDEASVPYLELGMCI